MTGFSRSVSVTGLSWFAIALMAIVPPLVALLVAYPFWRKSRPILGNLAGSVVIFGSALMLILRESVELDRLTRLCMDAGYFCFPTPTSFSRYSIYAFIALFQVFALFTISLSVEQRIRRRGYDPEWR